jgi:hypothetical protein
LIFFFFLLLEMNFIKATLDMSLAYFYKDRGAAIGQQVQEFIKLQPPPSTTDFAVRERKRGAQGENVAQGDVRAFTYKIILTFF